MEKDAVLLPDLPESYLTAQKIDKEKAGNATVTLLNALAGGEESFLSTLEGIVVAKDIYHSGSPTSGNSFLYETKNAKTMEQGLLDTFNNNLPISNNSDSLSNSFKPSLGVKGIVNDTVPINDSTLSLKTVLQNAEIENNKLEDVEDIEFFLGSLSGKTTVGSGESEIMDSKTTTVIYGHDEGEVTLGTDNSKNTLLYQYLGIETPYSTTGVIPINVDFLEDDSINKTTLFTDQDLKKSDKFEVNPDSKIQKGDFMQRVFEAESSKLSDVVQMNVNPENNDTCDNSLSPSKHTVQEPNGNGIKFGMEIPKGFTPINEANPGSLSVEKVLYNIAMETKASKYITEEQDNKISLNFESISKQHEKNTIGAGVEPQTISSSLKFSVQDSDKLEKPPQNGRDEIKTLKLSSESGSKEASSNSDSNIQNNGKDNLGATAETRDILTITNKSYAINSSGINRNPQVSEITSDNTEISNEEISDLQTEKRSDPEINDKTRFTNNPVRGMSTININPDLDQHYQNIKTTTTKLNALPQNIVAGKIIKLDPANGEASLLASNNQSTDKSFDTLFLVKDPPSDQRLFQTNVLSQLAEKAIMSLKNGQTSITIKLKPENLGNLRMEIMTKDNQVMIKIHTELPLIKDIIESNVNQLRTELQNQGLEIEKFDVSVDHGLNKNESFPERAPLRKMVEQTDDLKSDDDPVAESNMNTQVAGRGEGGNLINFFA